MRNVLGKVEVILTENSCPWKTDKYVPSLFAGNKQEVAIKNSVEIENKIEVKVEVKVEVKQKVKKVWAER